MNTQATAKPWPFQGKAYWTGVLISAVTLILIWFGRHRAPDNPVFALLVLGWTWIFGPGVAAPGLRLLPRHWFRVPAGERVVHRMLGVGMFGWLLDVSGWNHHLAEPMRGFSGRKAGLLSLEQSVRAGTIAHGTSFAVHIVLAFVAHFTGHPTGAWWILLSGVPTHLYPVLLQRSIMLRLQPLLDKQAVATGS